MPTKKSKAPQRKKRTKKLPQALQDYIDEHGKPKAVSSEELLAEIQEALASAKAELEKQSTFGKKPFGQGEWGK